MLLLPRRLGLRALILRRPPRGLQTLRLLLQQPLTAPTLSAPHPPRADIRASRREKEETNHEHQHRHPRPGQRGRRIHKDSPRQIRHQHYHRRRRSTNHHPHPRQRRHAHHRRQRRLHGMRERMVPPRKRLQARKPHRPHHERQRRIRARRQLRGRLRDIHNLRHGRRKPDTAPPRAYAATTDPAHTAQASHSPCAGVQPRARKQQRRTSAPRHHTKKDKKESTP